MFVIAGDLLVVGYDDDDGMDHDNPLRRVLLICQKVNLKLNKGKFYFRCSSASFLLSIIFRHDVIPDPRKLKAHIEMPPTQKRNSLE